VPPQYWAKFAAFADGLLVGRGRERKTECHVLSIV
jgi:hypothetical protein